MPMLKIQTNQPLNKEQCSHLLNTASKTIATLLNKSENYVMVSVWHNPNMLFAGSDDALAYLELKSIGLPATKTQEFSAQLCAMLLNELNLPAERIYIEFTDAPRALWGFNGSTF